jgi:hypothetical protein
MIASKDSFEPHSSEQLPASKKVFVAGIIHPDVRVPMREIELSPTKTFSGAIEVNEPVRVYDCSGPWGDPNFNGKSDEGLPALRRDWILKKTGWLNFRDSPAAAVARCARKMEKSSRSSLMRAPESSRRKWNSSRFAKTGKLRIANCGLRIWQKTTREMI